MRTTAQVLAILDEWPHTEFAYGRADCCRFAAFVAARLIGRDLMAGFAYTSEAEACEVLQRSGGLTGALKPILGDPAPKAYLEPGDPILIAAGGVELLGVYLGTRHVAALDIHGGMREISLGFCPYGWRLTPGGF